MTVTIHIEAHPDRGDLKKQIENSMSALGFERSSPTLREVAEAAYDAGFGVEVRTASETNNEQDAPASVVSSATRERGKPSQGRARRTKEEIAEDEAAEKADAARAAAAAETGAEVADRQISTGENRVGPEDSEADAEQDAADEAAETAASRDPEKPLTLDDVRIAVGLYQKTYGMAAVVADQPLILGCKLVEIEDTQEALGAAVDAMTAALEANPYGRAVVSAAAPAKTETPKAEPVAAGATKGDVVAAMKRYGKKYDGEENDPTKMPFASEDCQKVFVMLFGEAVNSISKVEPTPENYAKCVAGIDEMTAKNPFKRPSHA